jgi:hypothetical protein
MFSCLCYFTPTEPMTIGAGGPPGGESCLHKRGRFRSKGTITMHDWAFILKVSRKGLPLLGTFRMNFNPEQLVIGISRESLWKSRRYFESEAKQALEWQRKGSREWGTDSASWLVHGGQHGRTQRHRPHYLPPPGQALMAFPTPVSPGIIASDSA